MLKEHPWDSRGWPCPRYKPWCLGLCWQLWHLPLGVPRWAAGGLHCAAAASGVLQSTWGRDMPQPTLCTKLLAPLDPNVVTGVWTAVVSLRNISVTAPLMKALWSPQPACTRPAGTAPPSARPSSPPGACIGAGLGPPQHRSRAVQESIENLLWPLRSETFKNWT